MGIRDSTILATILNRHGNRLRNPIEVNFDIPVQRFRRFISDSQWSLNRDCSRCRKLTVRTYSTHRLDHARFSSRQIRLLSSRECRPKVGALAKKAKSKKERCRYKKCRREILIRFPNRAPRTSYATKRVESRTLQIGRCPAPRVGG